PGSCQAAPTPKWRGCRIKPHLPRDSVHKAGNRAALRHACTFVYKRYRLHRKLASDSRANGIAGLGTRMTQTPIRLTVNGVSDDVSAAPDAPLLYVLRNDLQLNGPKYGCGLGECGTCTVLIDGCAARACVVPLSGCDGRDIVTLEGLGTRDRPDAVQQAFIE